MWPLAPSQDKGYRVGAIHLLRPYICRNYLIASLMDDSAGPSYISTREALKYMLPILATWWFRSPKSFWLILIASTLAPESNLQDARGPMLAKDSLVPHTIFR